jgi:hypothetical protein
MKRLNWKIIRANIHEALEELEKLESHIASTNKPHEVELELSLRHAFHHINFAWNARHIETEKYRKLTKSDFDEWGKFPEGLDEL